MNDDWNHEEMPMPDTPQEAIMFLRETFLNAKVNLNPDVGFVHEDGGSMFPHRLTDEQARSAQKRLDLANHALREEGIDPWEVAFWMSTIEGVAHHLAHIPPHKLDPEHMTVFIPKAMEWRSGEGSMVCRGIPNLAEEDAQKRDRRRAIYVIDTVTSMFEGFGDNIARGMSGRASALPLDLLPPLWSRMLDNYVVVAGGATSTFTATMDNMPGALQHVIDEADAQIAQGDPDSDENDDDPFGWDA